MSIIFILAVLFAVAGVACLCMAFWSWYEMRNLPYASNMVYWLLNNRKAAFSFAAFLCIIFAAILFIA